MSLRAIDLSIVVDSAQLLEGICCDIQPGNLTVLIGPNGSGKTSLIKGLSGETQPSSGRVQLDGIDLHRIKLDKLARCRAVLPQHSTLDFPFTVSEVVALGRSPYQADQSKDDKIITAALALFDMARLSNRLYTTLSGGERQRVQLARVWAQLDVLSVENPKYLLLDEPSAPLDLKHQLFLMTRLQQATRSKELGLVIALHDLNAAARYADHLILLSKGQVLAAGSRETVLTTENIERAYEVPVEFVPYTANAQQQILRPS